MFYTKKLPVAYLLFLSLLLTKTIPATAQQSAIRNPNSAIDWVNPFIGTGGHGHTFPGATMPFGMVQLSPDTRPDPGDWDGCGGYHFSDSVIYGFSHTHLSGTGVSDYCDVLLQPVKPGAGFSAAETASLFYKKNERAEAGFYQVELEKPNVKVELTASDRVGFHRYNFAGKAYSGDILLDLKWRDLVLDANIDLSRMEEGIITGHRFSRSWATDQRLFFFLKFSKKPSGVRQNGREQAIFEFKWTSNGNHAVVVECAISSVDVAGAEANWKAETTNFDFEKAKNRAQTAWQKQLSKIEIEGGSDRDRTVFYTALYHTMIAPNIFSDVDGRYRGRDQQIHQAQKGATMYTVFSLWDTYRALHPLMTILEPDRVRDWMYTFWRQSEEGGKLPVWELAANETNCMIGNHSIPVIADAYLKGLVPDTLAEKLNRASTKSLNRKKEGDEMDCFFKTGYLPSEQFPESVSKTLETSFDNYAHSKILDEILRRKGYKHQQVVSENFNATFIEESAKATTTRDLSKNWRNLLNPATNHFQPKSNSTWLEPFDPTEVNFNYTEANAWQYGFIQHDFGEQIRAVGGQKAMIVRLDSLFFTKKNTSGRVQADITGLVGQYAQGNEPSHHIPYLYNYLGQPWKCQKLVRQILNEFFTENSDGLPGNDDCGQMSAWVVWSMLGLYPVCPVGEGYQYGIPSFSGWKINHNDGKSTSLTVRNFSKTGFYLPDNRQVDVFGNPMSQRDSAFWGNGNHEISMQPSTVLKGLPEWIWDYRRKGMFYYSEHPPVPFLTKSERVFTGTQTLELGCADSKATIYFTLDGSQPTLFSQKYTGPILIDKSTRLIAFAENNTLESPRMTAEFTQQADRKNWKTSLQNPPNNQYTARGDRGLIDGLRGGADFRSGGWMGFDGKELELVLDMGEAKAVSKLGIGFLQDDNSWIFIPQMVFFETSLDGKNWEPASTVLAKRATSGPGEGFLEDFETTLSAKKQARFIKIKTQSYLTCPAWHKGVGSAAWLFADEIWVE